MSLDLQSIRSHFPGLKQSFIFFDNPGGTQIARASLERINDYLVFTNANHGGAFPTGLKSDAILDESRSAMADFLNARRPEEIVFGPNMTTLTFSLSRALAPMLQPGDRIVVTRLDHDANVAPWLRIAEDRGCQVRWVDVDPADCTLRLDDVRAALAEHPRLVAVGYASNAVGTINPVAEIIRLAHAAGAWVFVDAVQYAPHGPIDVQALDCDFLACSAYKFFGPHLGILYGRYELLDRLRAYKVRPAPALPPGKFETGTQNHEGIAGALGALEYLEWVGTSFGEAIPDNQAAYTGRRLSFKKGLRAIREYEHKLSAALCEVFQKVPGLRLYGITNPADFDQRVPTFSFTLSGWTPRQAAERLGSAGINVWDGNYYALAISERLGVEAAGGMIRVGGTHYNTLEEVAQLGEVLQQMAKK